MAIKVPQSSFAAGELDPALQERTTLEKYRGGLKTARNVCVTRQGGVVSRPSRKHLYETKVDDQAVVIYGIPRTGYHLEMGALYVRIWLTAVSYTEVAHAFTATDLPSLHFETSGNFVYVFCLGKAPIKINYILNTVTTGASVFTVPTAPVINSVTAAGGPTGYGVDYAATYVQYGQETTAVIASVGASIKLPMAAGQQNTIVVKLGTTIAALGSTEVRIYRRPYGSGNGGGAFGFIGLSTAVYVSGADLLCDFVDFGGSADYSHQPPTQQFADSSFWGSNPTSWHGRTGAVYQQRLVLTESVNKEAILTSRPGFQGNFLRDYPLGDDSSLNFKAGSGGNAEVLRVIDSDGLVVFTTNGVYLNTGALTVNNLALDRKGKWVIDEDVPPIAVPGGVFFVDSATNSIRNLTWSNELSAYSGDDITIYSAHIFQDTEITSWAYQEGNYPLLWVTFDDGTFASFTYQFEQQMRAWTRHDSAVFVEQVSSTGVADQVLWLVRVDTTRYVELNLPKNVPFSVSSVDPDAGLLVQSAFMDSISSYVGLIGNPSQDGMYTVTPVDADTWDGQLTITTAVASTFVDPGPGTVGAILRFFDEDGAAYDLEVISRASNLEIVVQPLDGELPEEFQDGSFRLYLTKQIITGLDHLEGESVSVMVDGSVVCSPNNDVDDHPICIVTGGQIELPASMYGAIVHVGRPITADVETLDVDTVEQAPTLVESITCNKIYVKVHNSRGLFVGNQFGEGDGLSYDAEDESLGQMQAIDDFDVNYDDDDEMVGNRPPPAVTARRELMLPGDWKSQGRVCFRQVDPIHFQILSIIPDLDIKRRSDR